MTINFHPIVIENLSSFDLTIRIDGSPVRLRAHSRISASSPSSLGSDAMRYVAKQWIKVFCKDRRITPWDAVTPVAKKVETPLETFALDFSRIVNHHLPTRIYL